MGQDVDFASREAGGTSGSSPRRSSNAAAARLLGALQSRPGHAAVIAGSAEAAETLFAQVDAELVCYRRIRVTGTGLDAEAVVRALGADVVDRSSLHAIVAALATRARAAKAPILVVVARADEAGPTALERLRASFAAVPEANDVVQLVLLGGPALTGVLAQPEARPLAAQLETAIDLSNASRPTDEAPAPAKPSDGPHWARVALGIVLLVTAVPLISRWASRSTPPVAVPASAEPAAEPAVERAPEPAIPPSAPAQPREAAEPAVPPEAEPPPEAPEAFAPAEPTPPHTASVQVGAFREPGNAEALRERLARLFPDVTVVPVVRGGVRLHCVRLGGLANDREVAARLAALNAAGYSAIRVRD